MHSGQIRQQFFEFFEAKNHKLVASAPIVNKDDPTLMFTNAGMNQFKDNFLGTKEIEHLRVVDTQKCLRVSGKHNDLEEVGVDGYHHTMFEMLGNWSFGDYFKAEIIEWAYELLTEIYGLPADRLYATVFGGDKGEELDRDEEAAELWEKYLPADRVLDGSKDDNFWEMGSTGPCGPCSEIHIDLRPEAEIRKIPGREMVNKDHPQVVELWNLVFIQYNRLANGQLQPLKQNHVDTGMGFERLCMAIQGKTSNYETDVFTPLLDEIGRITGKKYENLYLPEAKKDIAFRVVADHVRAVAFTIADGQLPGNTGAGYVIRRILRRAVRYYYTFLDWQEPLLYRILGVLAEQFSEVFPELKAQEDFVGKVIREEEKSFLRTLEGGIHRFHMLEAEDKIIRGEDAFLLFDTYGFPIDLTQLMAKEEGLTVDLAGFEASLEQQKAQSRKDAAQKVGDWQIVTQVAGSNFVGYDQTEATDVHITRMRTIERKNKKIHQLVLDWTPFYPEGGGQIGDVGYLEMEGEEKIKVLDTRRENELIVHIVDRLPKDPEKPVSAYINVLRRKRIASNHTATHLLHAALREVLGDHVAQKGSLVAEEYLRFDFSHFEKMTAEELQRVEDRVNEKIEENIVRVEAREIPIEEARKAGARMLFGEKYGEKVRMITFDPEYSRELCGGIHIERTGVIRLFKIVSESAVAAGVRRIEARTGSYALAWLEEKIGELEEIKSLFKSPVKVAGQIRNLMADHDDLKSRVEYFEHLRSREEKVRLLQSAEKYEQYSLIAEYTEDPEGNNLKNIVYELADQLRPAIVVLGNKGDEKAQMMIYIEQDLATQFDLDAGKLIREAAGHIRGGGGGQPFFASAGGKNPAGIPEAVRVVKNKIQQIIETQPA